MAVTRGEQKRVHARLVQYRALQNPAYRPADMLRGLGGITAGPPPFGPLDIQYLII